MLLTLSLILIALPIVILVLNKKIIVLKGTKETHAGSQNNDQIRLIKWACMLVAFCVGVALLVIALNVPDQIAIDRCLDAGGRYIYETNECELPE